MKIGHLNILSKAIESALEKISEDGNPHYVYDDLAADMTEAAALIYDACMRGQQYAEDQAS